MVGLGMDNRFVTDTAFDIIALEALLLVPRSVIVYKMSLRHITFANAASGYAHY